MSVRVAPTAVSRTLATLCLVVAAVACSSGSYDVSTDTASATTAAPAPVASAASEPAEVTSETVEPDALDDTEMAQLGIIGLPDGAEQVDVVDGIPIYQTPGHEVNDERAALITHLVTEAPQKLTETPPAAIVVTTKDDVGGIQMINPRLAAFSSGPYLYLTTETFEGALLNGEQQPEDVLATFLHEWMHVEQWANVDDDAIASELADPPVVGYDDLITESDFLAEFAAAAGWQREETSTRVTFDLPESDPDAEPVTTEYGDSDPVEDQTETVASVFVGQPTTTSCRRMSTTTATRW